MSASNPELAGLTAEIGLSAPGVYPAASTAIGTSFIHITCSTACMSSAEALVSLSVNAIVPLAASRRRAPS